MIKAIITDIEGTTTSLSFVKDVLFPYARANLADFIRRHAEEPHIKVLMADAAKLVDENIAFEALIAQLLQWHDEDQKITPLKSLQGLIWEAGYQQGELRGHIYPEVVKNLQAWKAQGINLYVYSSGSVHAQKLLFGHTEFGDLTPLFSGYFDTRIGGKREEGSYRNIAEEINLPAGQLAFLSDIKEELDAAKAIGYQTVWLNRDGAADIGSIHYQVGNFDEIEFSELSGG